MLLINYVVFMTLIDFLVKLILQIVFIEGLSPVNAIIHTKLIELIKLYEGHAKSIQLTLQGIFLPLCQLNSKMLLTFNEYEETVV